jgi:hypothetical protein
MMSMSYGLLLLHQCFDGWSTSFRDGSSESSFHFEKCVGEKFILSVRGIILGVVGPVDR